MNEKKKIRMQALTMYFFFFGVSSDEAIPVSEVKMATN